MTRKNPTTIPEHYELGFISVASWKKITAFGNDFQFYRWHALDVGGIIVEGGNVIGYVSRGPRKGKPQFDRRKAIRVTVSELDVDSARAEYETVHGCCRNCLGSGEEWSKWDYQTGNHYRVCGRCSGTGRPTP